MIKDDRVSNKKLLVVRSNERYVNRCNLYQKIKNRMEAPVGKLIENKVLQFKDLRVGQ